MKKIKFIVFSLFTLVLFVGSANAWGFRPMAMGGAFTAVADDANCAYWNSAGAAQLDNFKDGESQIAVTDRVLDEVGILNRNPKKGDTYYDSFSFAKRINKNLGWSLAGAWSGGGAIGLIPSAAFRLPWNEKMSIGIGYFYFKKETTRSYLLDLTLFYYLRRYDIDFNYQGLNLDYLWKFHPEWSIGIHAEDIFQISDYLDGIHIFDRTNLQPGIAWMPKDKLEGLIVNCGIYDFTNKLGAGPLLSFGMEYTLKPKAVKVIKKRDSKNNLLYPQHSFRTGIYQTKSFALGYGYKMNGQLEIGYFGILSGDKHNHNIGFAWRF